MHKCMLLLLYDPDIINLSMTLYRNHHIAMEKILSQSPQRKNMHIPRNNDKIQLCHLGNHTIHIMIHYHAYD